MNMGTRVLSRANETMSMVIVRLLVAWFTIISVAMKQCTGRQNVFM